MIFKKAPYVHHHHNHHQHSSPFCSYKKQLHFKGVRDREYSVTGNKKYPLLHYYGSFIFTLADVPKPNSLTQALWQLTQFLDPLTDSEDLFIRCDVS